jgi:hypothetical protein
MHASIIKHSIKVIETPTKGKKEVAMGRTIEVITQFLH